MTIQTVEDIVRAGLEASYIAVEASSTFVNDGKRTFVHIVNGAEAMNMGFVTPNTVDGLAVADRAVAVGSSEEHFIGPFPINVYGTTVTMTSDATTNGTIAYLKVPAE
jgi:hypothetical protein